MLFLNVNPRLRDGGSPLSLGLGAEAERVEFPYARLALDLVDVERIESLERLRPALDVAHDLGVSIVLDDVTSGYGTLALLRSSRRAGSRWTARSRRAMRASPQRRPSCRWGRPRWPGPA